jgi:hypothetical protein
MEAHYNLPWVKLMKTMRQAHPSGTKPRFYPDAPSIKAFIMDFSPGFDVSKSSYALAEGHHYANGHNPFEPIMVKTDHHMLDELDSSDLLHASHSHIRPMSVLESEYARTFGHEFEVKHKPDHHLAKGARRRIPVTSSSDSEYATPDEAYPAIQDLMNRPDEYYSESRPKRVLKTAPQMMRFFAHKGIVSYDHTPGALKRQLVEMGLNSEYEAYVRRTRK